MEDGTNLNYDHILQKDLKDNLKNQDKWNKYCSFIVGESRKITEQTWKKIVIIESNKNKIDLKISRDPRTDIVYDFGKVPNHIENSDVSCNEIGEIIKIISDEEVDPYNCGCTSR